MEEVKTYMVDRGRERYIEMSSKVERVLNAANVHLTEIVRYFSIEWSDSNSDEEFFEENCKALATYQMLLKSREDISDSIRFFHDKETFELRFLGSLIEQLLVVENYVDENSEKLNVLNIDSEKILEKLYGTISPLHHFLCEHIPTVKQQGAVKYGN